MQATLAPILDLLAFPLSVLFGFVIHRSSVCTVKAVVEITSTRRFYMLVCFLKTALWVIVATYLLIWTTGSKPMAASYTLGLVPLLGGFIFGIGATINKGCAFSTLTYLASGNVGMLATMVGFALGVTIFLQVDTSYMLEMPVIISSTPFGEGTWGIVLVALVMAWAVIEIGRLIASRPRDGGIVGLVLTRHYRLSTAAVLLGLTAGSLYFLQEDWVFTSTLSASVGDALGFGGGPGATGPALLVALLLGIALSAWLRGTFRLRGPGVVGGMMHLVGGTLMGLGAAAVPGGNDVLILHSMPLMLGHAFLAYTAMLVGIAVPVLLMYLLPSGAMRLDCSGDVCRDE